ncbi:hypothetical protein BD408DRAFT_354054, partial [Parasitella parasitica]
IAILPSKAKGDFDSFLAPIIDEVNLLSEKTLVVKANGEAAVKCKVYIIFINGDGIEANRMLNFQGHMSTYGCRFCIAKGEHRTDGNNATGMYFADRNAPLRSKESLLLNDKSALFVNSAYGIKKPTVFGKLTTFAGVESIGFEELHAISNIALSVFKEKRKYETVDISRPSTPICLSPKRVPTREPLDMYHSPSKNKTTKGN